MNNSKPLGPTALTAKGPMAIFLLALLFTLTCPAFFVASAQADVDTARAKGLWWLITHQDGEGKWKSTPGTEVAATATALEALNTAGVRGFPYAKGISWLSSANVSSVDSLARKTRTLTDAGVAVTASIEQLLAWRNTASAWGAYDRFETSFPDTPLALSAVLLTGYSYLIQDLANAMCQILPAQKSDGSWSFVYIINPGLTPPPGQVTGAILPTTVNILLLKLLNDVGIPGPTCVVNNVTYNLPASINSGLNWLLLQKKADGGFGTNSAGTVFETSLAFEVLKVLQPSPNSVTDAALDYLIKGNGKPDPTNGSWNNDAFQTAFVLKLLPPPSPVLADTDRDGIPDVVEVLMGKNVNVPDSRGVTPGNGTSISGLTAATVLVGDAVLNQFFTFPVTASGGTPPYTNWTIVSGSLPTGLSLNSSGGVISGIPTVLGTFSFVYSVTDSAGVIATAVAQISVVRSPPSLATGDLNGDGIVDAADVALAERIALGLIVASPTQLQHGDVSPPGNPDGVIDAADVSRIRMKALQIDGF